MKKPKSNKLYWRKKFAMVMKDDDVIKKVLTYVEDERYCQAVLIDGEWGAGKTFFVKEKLLMRMKEELSEKRIYYISLYGVSSSEQIVDEIYSSMVEEIIDEKLGEKNGRVVEKGIFFTSKLITAGMKYFNVDTKDLPQLSDIKKLKDAIIIFDDLERCELEINQTLGVINNLVEHNDIKVILVANQKEIGKINFSRGLSHKYQVAIDDRLELDEKGKPEDNTVSYTKEQLIKRTEQLFSEDIFYKKVKEKLIGLTIYYQPNLAEVYTAVIEKFIKKEAPKNYLISNKQIIVNIFEEKRHYNIRTLIFALIAFEKFYIIIDAIPFEFHEYVVHELDKVLKYTMISAIQIKLGNPPYPWEKSSSKSGMVYYDIKNIVGNSVYGYRFVDNYLLQCDLNEKYIEETILEIVNTQKNVDDSRELENSLQYRKLYSWWNLEDEEIEDIVSQIYDELEQQKYSPRYFKEMIVTFMQMEYKGFSCFDYDKIVNLMEQKLKTYTGKFERRYLEVLSENLDFVQKYNQIVEPLFQILDGKEDREKIEDNAFLCNHECWDDNFEMKCEERSHIYTTSNAFFYYIDPQKFIEELKNAKVVEIHNFIDGIRKVYNFSNLNDFFKVDIQNIKSILEGMNVEELSREKKTRKMAIERLKSKLQEYLKLIEEPVCKM